MSISIPRVGLAGPAALALLSMCLGVLAGLDPPLALAAAFAVCFVLVVFADLSAGLALFTLLGFLDQLPAAASPALSLGKAAGLLLALSWLGVLATHQDARRNLFTDHAGLAYLLVLFIAWSALSQVWAESSSEALLTTSRYLLNVALLPLVFTAVRGSRDVVWCVAAYVAGASVAAIYGIFARPEVADELERLAGTIGDPNQLAALMAAGVVLAVGLAGAAEGRSHWRVAALGAAFLCLLAACLTLSRGGLVALGLGLIAAVVLGGRWRARAAILAVTAVGAAVVYFGVFAPEAVDRIFAADGGAGRTDIWQVGWRMVEDEPVHGIGSGNFPVTSIHYLLEPGAIYQDEFIVAEPSVAHNVYLEVLAELGVVGLMLFLAIVVVCLRCAYQAAVNFAAREELRNEVLARAVLIATIVILAADFFISDQFAKQLWLLLGLGPALLAISARPQSPKHPASARARLG